MKRSDIEIMAPAGSYEALAAAIQAGADAVYFGVGKLTMRAASAANFTLDDLGRIVATATATGGRATLAAPAPGLYVVRCGGQAVKVLVR